MNRAPKSPGSRWHWLAAGLVAVLAVCSVASKRRERSRFDAWAVAHMPAGAWSITPAPTPLWSPWPAWLHDLKHWVDWTVDQVAAPLVVAGISLAVFSIWPRADWSIRLSSGRRCGPGRMTAWITMAYLPSWVGAVIQMNAIDPTWQNLQPLTFFATAPRLIWFWLPYPGGGIHQTIGTAWLYLVISGRWPRLPEDAVERVGRWLGWTWIVLATVSWIATILDIR